MKSKVVIGTVAGLISLATASNASIITSSITNQPLNLGSGSPNDIDIDNDTVIDFQVVYGNSSFQIIGLLNNLIAEDTSQTRRYSLGETILFSDPNQSILTIGNLINQGTSYVGVLFAVGGTSTNLGWLEFNYPTTTPTDGVLVRAAWESNEGQDIAAGVVPEPNTAALSFFGILTAWFSIFRRRKKHVTQTY